MTPPPLDQIDRVDGDDVPVRHLPPYRDTARDLARIDAAEARRDWDRDGADDDALNAYEHGMGLR